ncbi:hypothetical protein BpHYR1_022101 [Brachionus plicatilis]|uniref:MULE transposase domain-containing protein n=1 Tax=Brachionus plicatilis TaxID=10195 RepID=A0A3M7SVH2_BRAPC|nr:hypothetical protein BpHYR1_022101 [Brachionus plicatilis]
MVYGLLPNKSQKIYERFLSKIKEALNTLPLSLTCDFEKGFMNAVDKVFQVPVYDSYFHFKQNMFRKIQALRLREKYNEDGSIRHELKLPQGLAFLPKEDVISAFEKLKARKVLVPETKLFYEYIEDSYIGQLKKLEGAILNWLENHHFM